MIQGSNLLVNIKTAIKKVCCVEGTSAGLFSSVETLCYPRKVGRITLSHMWIEEHLLQRLKCQVSLKIEFNSGFYPVAVFFFFTCQRHPKNTAGRQITIFLFYGSQEVVRWKLEWGAERSGSGWKQPPRWDSERLSLLPRDEQLATFTELIDWNETFSPSAGCLNTRTLSQNSQSSLRTNREKMTKSDD